MHAGYLKCQRNHYISDLDPGEFYILSVNVSPVMRNMSFSRDRLE